MWGEEFVQEGGATFSENGAGSLEDVSNLLCSS